jgi:hypothetical protein
MVGMCPLTTVGWPALTSGAVPRSSALTREKMPTEATTIAQASATTMMRKCVARSALYMEWFITTFRSLGRFVAAIGLKVHLSQLIGYPD